MIAVRRGWGRYKPPQGAQINWGHPMANGLFAAAIFDGGIPRELASGVFPGTLRTDRGSDEHSVGLLTTTVQDVTIASFTLPVSWPDHQPFTLAVLMTPIAWGAASGTDVLSHFGGAQQHRLASATAAPSLIFRWLNRGGFTVDIEATANPALNELHTIAASYDGIDWTSTANTGRLYIDGRQDGSTTASMEIPTGAAWSITKANFSSGNYLIHHSCVWFRVLSPTELEWFHVEPYAMLAPPAPYRRIFSGRGAAAAIFTRIVGGYGPGMGLAGRHGGLAA